MNTITLKKVPSLCKEGNYRTKLSTEEFLLRINRLLILCSMMEEYEDGEGKAIFNKAYKALNKNTEFNGIIRLNNNERDFLGYELENPFLSEEEINVIKKYGNL